MYYTIFSKKNKSVERESNIQKALSYYFSHEEAIRAVAKRFEIHPSTFHGRLVGEVQEEMGVVQEEMGVVQEEMGVVQENGENGVNVKIAESPFSIL
jgi:hypothetical protein